MPITTAPSTQVSISRRVSLDIAEDHPANVGQRRVVLSVVARFEYDTATDEWREATYSHLGQRLWFKTRKVDGTLGRVQVVHPIMLDAEQRRLLLVHVNTHIPATTISLVEA